MAALFLLALALIVWQGMRTKPLRLPPLAAAWKGGEQVFPIAAPSWGEPIVPPAELPARYRALQKQSVPWPGVAASGKCEIFIRTSSTVWLRRGFDHGVSRGTLYYAAKDFLDDDDGDGDTLDVGELTRSGPGAEVDVFCPPPRGESRP